MRSSRVLAFPTPEHERAVLALFPDATPDDRGRYRARCVGHDDNKPSLSIAFSETGQPLVKCFAGCHPDTIAQGLSLKNAHALYAALEGRKSSRAAIRLTRRPVEPTEPSIPDSMLLRHRVATYHYRDEHGTCLYEVRKYKHRGEKTFRQFQPDGTPGLKNVGRVVYRLGALHRQSGLHVYWVEGEKCVSALVKAGVSATTSAGGANGYKPEDGYPRQLKRAGIASVTVLPDNDEPGRAYASSVAQDLQAHGIRVNVLALPGLPPKGDIADWLDAGHTVQDLRRLRKAAPPYQSPASHVVCLADVEPEDVTWVWRPYIPLGKVTLIEGDPGIGKSWLTLHIAASLGLGDGLPGMPNRMKPQRVLLLTAEDGLGDTVRPRLDGMHANLQTVFALDSAIVFNDAGIRELEAAVKQVRPRIVIVDPFVAYLGADVDLHRANETRAVIRKLQDVATTHACAIVLVRHLTKASKDKSIYRGLGSIDITAACRSVLLVGVDPEDESCAALVHIKSSLAKKGPSQGYTLEGGRFRFTGESTLTAAHLLAPERDEPSALDEACDFLKITLAGGAKPVKDIQRAAETAGLTWRTLKRAKQKLSVLHVDKRDDKKHFIGFTWRLPKGERVTGPTGQEEAHE